MYVKDFHINEDGCYSDYLKISIGKEYGATVLHVVFYKYEGTKGNPRLQTMFQTIDYIESVLKRDDLHNNNAYTKGAIDELNLFIKCFKAYVKKESLWGNKVIHKIITKTPVEFLPFLMKYNLELKEREEIPRAHIGYGVPF